MTKLGVSVLLSAMVWTAGCTLTKTENPLSPSVAGPIPGVNITAPNPLTPRDGQRVFSDQQPLTLLLNNATTTGVRPIHYLFEVASDAGFATMVLSVDDVIPGEGGRTSVKLPQSLGSGRMYYWRAKAQDGANEGPYSPSASFEVVTPVSFQAPVLTAPANGSTTATVRPTFSWNNAARSGTPNGPVVYEIEVTENLSFNPHTEDRYNETPGLQTSVVLPREGNPNTRYYWRVRATDAITLGPWSPIVEFRTPASSGGGGGGGTGGGGTGGGGGPVGTACHVGPGPLTVARANDIVYGCGSEFPHLLAVFGTEDEAINAAEELLLRTIWHLQLAGYQAARQRNPSGLISKDKFSLFVDGAWHVYDIYRLGFAGVATEITGLNEVPLPNPVPDNGIPD